MLALHLLQNCLVYINTLMIQKVLGRPHWERRLTAVDRRALTPLIWEHVNPTDAMSSTWKPDLRWLSLGEGAAQSTSARLTPRSCARPLIAK